MQLTKHHGLGNDFLVLVDLEDAHPVDADVARALCDRHRGVGADGLLRVTGGEAAPFRMELRNEDGSRAEMSGNGISCLAQALVLAGHAEDTLEIETDAGLRVVEVLEAGAVQHRMRVAMGAPSVVGDRPEWVDDRVLAAVQIDVGNPHLVCRVAAAGDAPDLEAFGARVNAAIPGGANVELVAPRDAGAVDMTVYERGVGPTLACGTGAVATALAASRWELAGQRVTVHQPGGPAVVELGGPGAPAHLTVPVEAVARVTWPW